VPEPAAGVATALELGVEAVVAGCGAVELELLVELEPPAAGWLGGLLTLIVGPFGAGAVVVVTV